jgi:uncharacterized protein YodC (DUF2158 family)
MADEIKAGDVVELKSGGPRMTVAKVENWNGVMRATCHWFEGDKPQQGYFPVSSLERSEP